MPADVSEALQLLDLPPHHVVVEGGGVGIHHVQQFIHGLIKWRNQPPHHTVQILKLPLPIRHLTNHGTQCGPLQEGYEIK